MGSNAESIKNHARALIRRLAKRPFREYSTFDIGRERDTRCISVVFPKERAKSLVLDLRIDLPAGLVTFIGTTQWYGNEQNKGVEVVVGPGTNQFGILRLARSDAINCDMTTEQLIQKLETYDKEFGIQIFHAETDIIEFDLVRFPSNLSAFANDLYEFCPDIVDQGCGTINALQKEVKEKGSVFLWWD